MKKSWIMLAAIALTLVSCTTEIADVVPEENAAPQKSIVFNLTANHPDGAATKAVKTAWEDGDVIYVFFNKVAAPRYLKMSYVGTQWTYTQMNGAEEASFDLTEGGSTGTMRAVCLPFGNALTVRNDGTSFTFSDTTYSYYLTATLDYTVTDGKVSGAFNMAVPDGYVQFFLDDAGASASTEIELREPHLTPQGIASVAADGTIIPTSVAHGAPLPGYVYDKAVKETGESKGYLFSGILAAGARNTSTDYYFTLVSGGWQGTYYQKAFGGRTWYRSATEGRSLKMPALSGWTTITDYKPIDLGLDVGGKRIYWSSRNLGASSDFPAADSDEARHATWGDYYAWGETAPYYTENPYSTPTWKDGKSSGYELSSYSYATINGDFETFSKYTAGSNSRATSGTADGLTQLEKIDDAVCVKLPGTLWRMPTEADWRALMGDRDPEYKPEEDHWTKLYTESGRKVYGTVDGYTDRYIFLPSAGYYSGTVLHDIQYIYPGDEYPHGHYWSSSLSDNVVYASHLYFNLGMYVYLWDYTRGTGFTIRPVSD